MISSICHEIQARSTEVKMEVIDTIYFGGGTPSLLDQKALEDIFSAIHASYQINPNAEVTLEANPDDISIEKLALWKAKGINRLSVGLQSFRDQDLKWMNRAHSAKESKQCLERIKEIGGFSVSVDLIYGLPNLSIPEWENEIMKVIHYDVDHVSAYCLTVEDKTALAKAVSEGAILPSNEEEQSEQYVQLVNQLKESGYEQYEVSNFCRPGKESKHNSSYWKGITYLGFGPSAHSFDGKTRRFNVRNNTLYMKHLRSGKDYFGQETLTRLERHNEMIMTGLRTKWGVNLLQLLELGPLSPGFLDKVTQFKANNWLKEEKDHLYLVGEGWLMADHISSELFEL